MNYKKAKPHSWLIESRTLRGFWYDVYYKNCGGRCSCKSFRYLKRCPHLDFVRELVEQSGDFDAPLTFEEEILYG